METTVTEPVPSVQQPDWNQQPIFDASFAGTLVDWREPPECPGMGWSRGCNDTLDSLYHEIDYTSAATGAGDVFVTAEEKDFVASYDGVSLALKRRFEHPELNAPRALTYYRGELFVIATTYIYVFDASSGAFRRRFDNPHRFFGEDFGPTNMTAGGIDAAWGELWITLTGGANGGGMTVLDAQTGSLKAVHLHLPKQNMDAIYRGCSNTAAPVVNLTTCEASAAGWLFGGRPAPTWNDLATVPEERGVIAQCRFIQRGDLIQPAPVDGDLVFDLLPDDQCDNTGPQDGVDAVWGMHWFLAVESPNDGGGLRVNEYGIEPNRDKPWLTPLRRTWRPNQGSMPHPVRYDVAYQARETRIDWGGPLKTQDWLRGTKCANYVVSDGDIFVTGSTAERWYEPARGFQKIELWFDGILQDTKTTASGQLCGNTASVGSGTHAVTLKAFVNNGTRVVTASNDSANFDNTAPAGVLDATPAAVRATVTLAGSVTDNHSHPQRWRAQILRGGSWQNLCDVANATPDQPTFAATCTWDTSGTPDGNYQLRIQSVDLASDGGNFAHSAQRAITVDNTLPVVHEVAPALGSDVGATIGEVEAEVLLHQTDSGSGVDRSDVEYNTATDGSATGGWVPAGAAPGQPNAVARWDTTRVEAGLHRVRARTSDRAGNVRTTEWQLVVAQRRRRNVKCSTEGWEHCRAGFINIGRETSWGNVTLIGGSGILGFIDPPSTFPTSTSAGWSVDFFNLVGAKGGEPYLEVGVGNGNCGQPELGWFIFGVFTPPYGRAEDQIYQCILDRDGNLIRANSRRQYRAVLGKDKRVRMYYEDGGSVRIAMIRDQNSYLAASRGADLQAYGETNTHGRQLAGGFSAVRYNPNPPGGSWGAPPESTPHDSSNGYGYRSHYSSTGNDARYFCVHGPRRGCSPPSP